MRKGKMDPKKTNGNLKLSRSSIQTEKLKVGQSSMEASKVKISTSSIEAEKLKVQTSVTETSTVNVNKMDNTSDIDAEKIQHVNKDPVQNKQVTVAVPVDDRPYDDIQKVNKKKEIWRLGVMVDDMWTTFKQEKSNHIDMVVRDVKGHTIMVTIPEQMVVAWTDKFAEGKTYHMRNFKVHDNNDGYKYTPHSCRLYFCGATRVDEVEINEIPKTAFQFCDFAEIINGKFTGDVLVDAIGVVDSIKKVVTGSAAKKGNVAFTLKDLSHNVIDVTLWDPYSVEFLNYYSERNDNGPPVIIIKHAKVKEPNGIYPLQLTNVWNGTKLLFEKTVPAINTFINSLSKDATYPSQSITPGYSSQYHTQASVGSQFDPHENFMRQGTIISLADMKNLKIDTFCVTVAYTSHIITNSTGWYYRSCTSCNCKAEGNVPPFLCRKGHYTENPPIKYKLDVQVEDGDDVVKFVFWDSILEELLGLTAATLLQMEQERGYGDSQEYPKEINHIMERQFAFKVKWTKDWGGQASIFYCKDDQELVAKIKEHLPAAETSMQEVDQNQPDDADLCDSPPIQKFTQADIDNFARLDDSILSTPNVSRVADNEMSASSQQTPAKRGAGKQVSVDHINLEVQGSSTRSGKLIKKEKP